MAVKCSVFIATSLDGYIARPDGDIDWLHRSDYAVDPADDFGYQKFMSTVDVLVMGRNSFDKVRSFAEWPYKATPVWVLSSRSIDLPTALQGKVKVLNATAQEVVAQLSLHGYQHVYLDGGDTISRFLRAGLVHEMTLTRVPVLLGKGRPLFGELSSDVHCQLLHSASYRNGFVQSTYAVSPSYGAH
jgi:dihydrofolate reductase